MNSSAGSSWDELTSFAGRAASIGWTAVLMALTGAAFLYGMTVIPQEQGDLKRNLILLAITGALGGLAWSISRNKGQFVLCSYPKDGSLAFGTFGDMLIGVSGALGVFLVLAGTLKLDDATENILRIMGLGVVSGYGGRTLLEALRTRLEEMLAARRAEEESKRSREVSQRALARILVRSGMENFDKQEYSAAQHEYDWALELDPDYARPYLGRGRILKIQGKYARAVEETTRAIEIDRTYGAAWYNRSCYRSLNGEPLESILADLQEAVRLNPRFRELARTDEDFATVRGQDAFRQLIGTGDQQ